MFKERRFIYDNLENINFDAIKIPSQNNPEGEKSGLKDNPETKKSDKEALIDAQDLVTDKQEAMTQALSDLQDSLNNYINNSDLTEIQVAQMRTKFDKRMEDWGESLSVNGKTVIPLSNVNGAWEVGFDVNARSKMTTEDLKEYAKIADIVIGSIQSQKAEWSSPEIKEKDAAVASGLAALLNK